MQFKLSVEVKSALNTRAIARALKQEEKQDQTISQSNSTAITEKKESEEVEAQPAPDMLHAEQPADKDTGTAENAADSKVPEAENDEEDVSKTLDLFFAELAKT